MGFRMRKPRAIASSPATSIRLAGVLRATESICLVVCGLFGRLSVRDPNIEGIPNSCFVGSQCTVALLYRRVQPYSCVAFLQRITYDGAGYCGCGIQMKKLSRDNWLLIDPVIASGVFARFSMIDGSTRSITADEWAERLLAIELSQQVPDTIHELFEVARGATLYGSLYYALFTLGLEQAFRLAEAAARLKAKSLGLVATDKGKPPTYYDQCVFASLNDVIHPSPIASIKCLIHRLGPTLTSSKHALSIKARRSARVHRF